MSLKLADLADFFAGDASPEVQAQVIEDLNTSDSSLFSLAARARTNAQVWFHWVTPATASCLEEYQQQVTKLLDQAVQLAKSGNNQAALDARMQAYILACYSWGEEHRETATCLNGLGKFFYSVGKYEMARDVLSRTLDIRIKVMGSDHSDTGITLTNLGRVHEAFGEYHEAVQCHEQAVAISEKELGKEHPDTAVSLNDYGCALMATGKYAEAKTCFERSLNIDREYEVIVEGREGRNTAIGLGNVGQAHQFLQDFITAKKYFDESLALLIQNLGEDHIDVAWAWMNLGSVHQLMRNPADCQNCYEQALPILTTSVGEQDLETISCLNSLGVVYLLQGKQPLAQEHFEKALQGCINGNFDSHPLAFSIRSNLEKATGIGSKQSESTVELRENIKLTHLIESRISMSVSGFELAWAPIPWEGRIVACMFILAA